MTAAKGDRTKISDSGARLTELCIPLWMPGAL